MTALNQANVAVNAVDSNGLGGPPRRWQRNTTDTMQQIADATGGEAYLRRNDLAKALADGIQAARDSYTLGFYLADEERDGKFHRLEVSADRPSLRLQYRPGYFAAAGLPPDSSQQKLPLESVLLSPVDSAAIGITADVVTEPGQPRGTIRVRLNLDLATLQLNQIGDIYSGKIDEMFLELDERGQQLGKVSGTRELQIPESQRERIVSQGAILTQTLPLAEGASRLSIIVRDAATGQVGRLTVPLETRPK